MNLELQIKPYESWMEKDVIEMFNFQYNFKANEFAKTFENFYEHDFQKSKGLRIVALDNNKVVGFQSFFFWPYQFKNKVYNSYQSGNSIVHQDYRGKGIFGKLLKYTEENKINLGIDFLIGFPVEDSFNSFIRKGWSNPFNLIWNIKPISLLSILSPFNKTKFTSSLNDINFNFENDSSYVSLENSMEFQIYRQAFGNGYYFNHLFTLGNEQVHFSLKINIRKKVIKELIIGAIHCSYFNDTLLIAAFKDLINKVKKSNQVTLLSFAFPSGNNIFNKALENNSFKLHDRKIHFICDKVPTEIADEIKKGKFLTYRGDIDTW